MDNASNSVVDSILSAVGEMSADVKHFGVRGMKWGIRKTSSERADAKWVQEKTNWKESAKMYSEAAERMNKDLPAINSKYTDKSLQNPKTAEKYFKELDASFDKHVSAVAGEAGVSPSGTKKLGVVSDPLTGYVIIKPVDITQSATSDIVFKPVRDENGFVTKYVLVEDEIMQSFVEEGANFIEHFGVKGMRWGVRRSDKELARASGKTDDVAERKSKTSSKEDRKTRSGKASVKDLSDAELRQRLNRIQMEKQYAELTRPAANPLKSAGKKIAGNVVRGVAEQTLRNLGQSYATKYTKDYLASGSKAFGGATKPSPLPPPTLP